MLCYLEGKKQEDAAREMGSSKGTVSGRLARAKELLRARLSRRGFAPSAGLAGLLLSGGNGLRGVPRLPIARGPRGALGACAWLWAEQRASPRRVP